MENIIILNIHILVYLGHGPGGENSPHDEVATDANHSADAIPEVPVQQPNVPPEGLAVNNKVPSLDEFVNIGQIVFGNVYCLLLIL
jgi:hypothetical protein